MTGAGNPDAIDAVLARRFEALIFDWDGTAVPDRHEDATRVRHLIEELCAFGMHVAIVSGTGVDNIDGQLQARPDGPGTLVLAVNRGSEVFAVDQTGPRLVQRRVATHEEDNALDRAAAETVRLLESRGLRTELVSTRLNRRKIDVIPEPEWQDPPKAIIDRLLDAVTEHLHTAGFSGLADVVAIAEASARAAGLVDARVTTDVKHVEIGLTDKRDAAHWIVGFLGEQGVGPGTVLVAGDEFGTIGGVPGSDSWMLIPDAQRSSAISVGIEPTGTPPGVLHLGGGPARFVALLADQLERRRRGEVPAFDEDPAWILTFDGLDPERERSIQALLALSDGRLGSRGSAFVAGATAEPLVHAAGVYDGEGSQTHLLACPTWQHVTSLRGSPDRLRRVLDLRTGVLYESSANTHTVRRSARFSSLARPGSVALRAELPTGTALESAALVAPEGHPPSAAGRDGDTTWMQMAASQGGVVAAASQRSRPQQSGAEVLERLGTYVADPEQLPTQAVALERLHKLEQAGFERLLGEHRSAWARRWHDADVTIGGDEHLQVALRFGLWHVLSAAADAGEAAVGARDLTGSAYHGHVFWDAELFVLPVLVATHPAAARAMLEYRIRRLPAARAIARAEHRVGSRALPRLDR